MFRLQVLFHYCKHKYFYRFRSRAALLRWQERKVVKFISWVRHESAFYALWCKGIPARDWRRIPLIDKSVMMENLSTLNTVGVDRDEALRIALRSESDRDFSPKIGRVSVGLSSGTSGNRGLFLVADDERARYAGAIMAKVLPRSIFSAHRVAFFMRANNNLYTATRSRNLHFEFFDLLRAVRDHTVRLEQINPTLLFAPPSVLLELAKQVSGKGLNIRPEKIYAIAETLDELDRKRIEMAFGSRVHQVYQCTEGFLGITCAIGVLHLNEDLVSIECEWIDRDSGKFIPIITDFSRRTQPIIRYRLNDILTVRKEPCPCGSPLLALECIEGRTDDVVFFTSQSSEGWVSVLPDFVRRSVIRASGEISEYAAVQNALGELDVSLSLTRESSRAAVQTAVIAEIETLCREVGASPPTIRFIGTPTFTPGTKLRRIKRVCAPPDSAVS